MRPGKEMKMGLPRQVQQQLEAVEQFDKAVAANTPPTEPQEPEQPTPPAPENATKPEVEPAAPPKKEESVELWKQRFQSLQGMYNSQVPALQQQVRQLTEQVEQLRQPKPEEPAPSGQQLVTETDEQAFGKDLIDVIRRGAREEIAQVAQKYETTIAKLERELEAAKRDVGAVAQTQAVTSEQAFYSGLDRDLPRWRDIQGSEQCQEWLGTRVPGMAHDWNSVLVSAAERYDLPAVLEVFNEFFVRYPAMNPKAKRPAPTQPSPKPELARQVAPSKTNASVPTQTNGKRMYSGAEYEQESMRIVRLSQSGHHDEAQRLEAELNAALQEGRVR